MLWKGISPKEDFHYHVLSNCVFNDGQSVQLKMKSTLITAVFWALSFFFSSFDFWKLCCFWHLTASQFPVHSLWELGAYQSTLVSPFYLVTTSWIPLKFVFSASAPSLFYIKLLSYNIFWLRFSLPHLLPSSPSPPFQLHVFFLPLLRKQIGKSSIDHWLYLICQSSQARFF